MITEERKQELIKEIKNFSPGQTITLKGNECIDIKIQDDEVESLIVQCYYEEDGQEKRFDVSITDEYTWWLYMALKNYFGDL